jgi:chromate transport protein ChrA
VEAVLKGAWLPARIFLDCIAIGNILPAPLVIFATFVGYQGGLVDGVASGMHLLERSLLQSGCFSRAFFLPSLVMMCWSD